MRSSSVLSFLFSCRASPMAWGARGPAPRASSRRGPSYGIVLRAPTRFDGLAASGWHTVAATMRLLVEGGLSPAGRIIGAGRAELKWPRARCVPARSFSWSPRCSRSVPCDRRPTHGLVKVRTMTANQRGESTQVFVMNSLVPRRVPGRQADHEDARSLVPAGS